MNGSSKHTAGARHLLPGTLALFAGAAAWPLVVAAEPSITSDRVVHRFDFNERVEGNLEPLPKYWTALQHPGFPSYSQARFDMQEGHDAPPSFYLTGAGRDTSYVYRGPALPVRRGTAYRVSGWIRPDRLVHARACLSAFYLDSQGLAIAETLIRSALVGGGTGENEWLPVDLQLAEAPQAARSLGVAAWVLQEATWNASVAARRPIHKSDVEGGAWFDDISVFALPRLEFAIYKTAGGQRIADSSNVVLFGEPAVLGFTVDDEDRAALSAEIDIYDAQGARIKSHQASGAAPDSFHIPLSDLPVGVYDARLLVRSAEQLVLHQTLRFAKLAPLHGKGRAADAFGVSLDPAGRLSGEGELSLLSGQHVHSVKTPIWPGMDEDFQAGAAKSSDLLAELQRGGYGLTGVLARPPRTIAESYGTYSRSVFDLLADDPQVWQSHLAAIAASYANTFRWWQIGPDAVEVHGALSEGSVSRAVANLRGALQTFVVAPRLAISAAASAAFERATDVERLTVIFDGHTPLQEYGELIAKARAAGAAQITALVHPLSEQEYDPAARLGDWARRILFARHGGADVVFVPQTWGVQQLDRRRVAVPKEEYLVLRTIADAIGDATPGPRLALDDGVECLAFYAGDEAVLALWDDFAPAEGRPYAMQLGGAAAQIDSFGNGLPLPKDEHVGNKLPLPKDEHGRQILTLSRAPIFVRGADRALIELLHGIRLDPSRLDARQERAQAVIRWKQNEATTVSGQCEIVPPTGWDVSPRSFRFALPPGQETSFAISFSFAHNEPVGEKKLTARIKLDSGLYLEVPLRLKLQFPGLDVRAAAILEGDDLVLRQRVHNSSTTPVHLRGFAAVPGRERQYRPFVNLQPGTTQTTEYRFTNAADLAGRRALLSLRELNDTTAAHTLELRIP